MPITVKARAKAAAEILIYDPIGEDWLGEGLTAKSFDEDLKALGEVADILVRINSPGGSVFDAIAIYNILKNHPAQVHVQVDGLAASAASVIAMAGDLITMGVGTQMMIHSPWWLAMGNAADMRKAAETLDTIEEGMIDAYVARTSLPRDDIKAMLDAETWMGPEDAVAKGFADAAESDDQQDDASGIEDLIRGLIAKRSRDSRAGSWSAAMASFRNTPQSLQSLLSHSAGETPSANDAEDSPKEDNTMPDKATASVQNADIDKARDEAVQAALKAEQDRTSAIRARFGKFAEAHRALLDACLEDRSVTADIAGARLLAELGKDAAPLNPSVVPGADARDKLLEGGAKAILARAGLEKRDSGNEFFGFSLTDFAAHALQRAGTSVRGMTRDQIARKVLASHTTSDFPLLLANTAGKILRQAYSLAPVTWNRWCKVGSVSDFKQASRHTLGSFSSLLTKPEGGEYQQGTIGEEREPITASTKGRYIQLTREMLVNDDLGGFAGMAQKMGRAAARTVESDVYTLLTSAAGAGPTMSDSGAFFNSTAITTGGGHANLAGSGTAITVAAIAAGEAAMMSQKDKGLNDFVAIMPRFLVTSPAKKQIGWEVVNSLTDVSQSNSAKRNYVQAQLNLEVLATPYLAGNPWYLFSDPADVEAFEVAFLDGQQEPFIDEEIEFMTDAMNMKVRLDYGVAAIDWRAAYRNPGA